ncbi:MAG: mannose-1-phosphate guanylyltransferase [Gemmatimonadaceae bacterium]
MAEADETGEGGTLPTQSGRSGWGGGWPPPGFHGNVGASADEEVATLTEPSPQGDAMLGTDAAMWAVVLAGGIGSRFWPLSSSRRPKQLLALVGDKPLIADTVARLAPLVPPERVLVVTSRDIAGALHAAIPEVPEGNMLVEPRPMGTAAAVAWAAQEVSRRAGPEAVFVTLHADLSVGYPDEFRGALRRAAGVASTHGLLVVVGATPTRPDTQFGYVIPGEPVDAGVGIDRGGACRAHRFVEKPSQAVAQELIGEGALWSTGVFVWQARAILAELTEFTPEVAEAMPALVAGNPEGFLERVRAISIDRGLLERSGRVVVLPAEFMWDDVGTWNSLRRARALDDDGNGARGEVHFVDAGGNVVHTEAGAVVLFGVSSMLVVSLPGLTFVAPLERAKDLKPLLDQLPEHVKKSGTHLA